MLLPALQIFHLSPCERVTKPSIILSILRSRSASPARNGGGSRSVSPADRKRRDSRSPVKGSKRYDVGSRGQRLHHH
eukprot:1157685-Pelagomonas_calceolata.AAC.11